jgi:hypothetical protein
MLQCVYLKVWATCTAVSRRQSGTEQGNSEGKLNTAKNFEQKGTRVYFSRQRFCTNNRKGFETEDLTRKDRSVLCRKKVMAS